MNLTTSSLSTRLLRQRLPRVCVPVVGHKPPEMLEKAEQVARDNSFIEFRLDYLAHPPLFFPKLKDFIEYHPHVTLMATCRRANNGGRFRGSIASEVDILTKAGAAGCHLLDIELESASHLKPHDWQKLKKNAGVILSYHDFLGSKKLEETFRKMEQYPADFLKIVTTAGSLYDNVTVMKFLEAKSDLRPLIGLCMGEQGVISRLLSVRVGDEFNY